ncbi:unnamed protein product [Amoebophrya sp. A120]|nr:unnamed protein product [Amoebophrya sp. A120]|eukprot:GSA120T00004585001.1
MASLESIHVKVKRKNQTFFLLCDTADMTVLALKEKLVLLFADKGIKSPLDIRLLYEVSVGIESLPYIMYKNTDGTFHDMLCFVKATLEDYVLSAFFFHFHRGKTTKIIGDPFHPTCTASTFFRCIR